MALSNDTDYTERKGDAYGHTVLAGVTLYKHAIGGITAAKMAVPAGHGSCVALLGLAEERRVAGEIVKFKKGTYQINVPAATPANIGANVYATADDTVTLDNTGSPLKIGTLADIDDRGTWVKIS